MPHTGGAQSWWQQSSIWKARLTDAVLEMADKLIGGMFAKARNATRQRYVASAGEMGRLMRLFHGTIEALVAAQESDTDAFEAVDEAVGWPKLLRVRRDVAGAGWPCQRGPADRCRRSLEDAAQIRARADRGSGVPRRARQRPDAGGFAVAARAEPIGQARDAGGCADAVPQGLAELVMQDGRPNRRLYETAVLATLRDKLRSGDVWVERSANYRRFDSYLLSAAATPKVVAELGSPYDLFKIVR